MARTKSRRNSKPKQSKDGPAKKRVPPKDTETKPKVSFWRRVLKTLPLMLLAVLFTFVLNHVGLFSELETTFLDTQMRMDAPAEESNVIIVDITPEDFANKDTFQGKTRPLNVSALQQLIEAIVEGQPCVVGVDIDTSFDQFQNFKADRLSNVVWSRSAEPSTDADHKHVPLKVLGRQDPALDERSGLPITKSEKGVTRFYSRLIETTQGNLPSFGWAIFKEAKRRNCAGMKFPDLEEDSEHLIIGYARGVSGAEGGGRTRITAGTIMKFAGDHWKGNNLIKDKIVLLGGSYLDEDKHDTPLGIMNGFEITANVIESDLRGGGTKPPGFLSVILLQVFDGFLLITLFQILPWHKAALMCLPLIVVLSLACSFFTYYSFSHWAFFVPVMIGVALTELFEEAKIHFKHRYRREITKTYQEFSGQPPAENQDPHAEE